MVTLLHKVTPLHAEDQRTVQEQVTLSNNENFLDSKIADSNEFLTAELKNHQKNYRLVF